LGSVKSWAIEQDEVAATMAEIAIKRVMSCLIFLKKNAFKGQS